jgi:hypothetical protein
MVLALAMPEACPPDTLLNPSLGVCGRVEDRREEFAKEVVGVVWPPDLRVLRGNAQGHPFGGGGDLSAGIIFRRDRLRVESEAVLYTKMIVRRNGAGSVPPGWLFTPATNRTDRTVEVSGVYQGSSTAQFGIFDWSCSPQDPCGNGGTAPGWMVIRPLTDSYFDCYVWNQPDGGGHSVPALYYANGSFRDELGRWENRVWLWNQCQEHWDYIYAHAYGGDQRDCSQEEYLCGWWGPILESHAGSPTFPILELGYFEGQLHHDGQVSLLGSEDVLFRSPDYWRVLHGTPYDAWAVASSGPTQTERLSFVTAGSSVGEGQPTALAPVRLTTWDGLPSRWTLTATYHTVDGTALAGEDYAAVSTVVHFPFNTPSGTTAAPPISVINDQRNEETETFTVRLTSPQGGILLPPSTHVVTIHDDDPPPSITVGDCQANEVDGVTVPCVLNVTLSAASGRVITVQYVTLDGTATAWADYVPTSGTLTFPPGTTTRTVTVNVVGDLLDEADESFSLRLSNETNAIMVDDTGTGTIVDNDPPPFLSIGNCSVTESTGTSVPCTFTASLSTPSGQGVTVEFTTQDGTARSPQDYLPASGMLSFPAGTTQRSVAVEVVGDQSDEPMETFSLRLSRAVNAILTNDTGTGTITDDDDPPTMSIRDVTVSDRNFGTVAYFTVALSAPSGFPVSVSYATADGTANTGLDYVARSGVLSFPLEAGKQAVAVPIIQDVHDEGMESFLVSLSGAVYATILDGQAEGTLVERSTTAPCSGRLDPDDDQTGLPVDLLISEIDPGDHIELYNPQTSPLALAGVLHHLTSPLEAVKVAALGASVVVPARGYARLPWPPEFSDTDDGGEVILYRDRHFEDSQKIVDFTCWGTNPHQSRIDQASEVGKWLGLECGPGLAEGALNRLAFTRGTSPADYDRTSPPSP